MISKRFKYDGKTSLPLNALQKRARDNINNRIQRKIYEFEVISCPICGSDNYEVLSEKDRYGLYMSTVICKICGLLFTNPRMTKSSYELFYKDDQKFLYTGTIKPNESYFEKQVLRGISIINNLFGSSSNIPNDLTVLEIGCSSGGILKAFKDSGSKVYGCDINSDYVNYGISRGLDLEVGTVDSVKIPWTPNIIIYSHTLEHVMDPVKEMMRLRNISGEETLLYIELPGIKNLWKSYGRDLLQYLQNAHTFHFSLRTLRNFAALSGWSLISGDETIKAVFKKGAIKNNYRSDVGVLRYLRRMEIYRLIPTPYRLKYIIKNG